MYVLGQDSPAMAGVLMHPRIGSGTLRRLVVIIREPGFQRENVDHT